MGIEKRLREYSLALDHKVGGPKANGFWKMLRIDLASIDYLDQAIRAGIARTPISLVRLRAPGVVLCTVQFPLAGPGRYSQRTAVLRTGWQIVEPDSQPLMTTAFLRNEER